MKTLPHFHEIAPMRHIKEETSRQCTGCIHEINAAQMKSLSHKNMTGPGAAATEDCHVRFRTPDATWRDGQELWMSTYKWTDERSSQAERQFPSTDKRRPISMPCSQAAQNLFDN